MSAPDTIAGLTQQLRDLRARHTAGQLDQDGYHKVRKPIERKLVDLLLDAEPSPMTAPSTAAAPAPRSGWGLKLGIAAAVVVVAGAGYWITGSPQQAGQAPAGFAGEGGNAANPPHEMGQAEMASMAERLAERLKTNPNDAEGWRMLGRTYNAMGDAAQALGAYEQLMKLQPNDATALADYADALAVRNGRSLEGEPMKFIEKALKADPDNIKALALAGTDAFNRGDYTKAVQHWERLVKAGPPDHPIVEQIRGGIEEARKRGGLPGAATGAAPAMAAAPAPAVKPGAAPGPAAVAGPGTITGTVTLAPELKGKVSPDDVVFIFARPAEGSRMPLAILRLKVADLPYRYTLDDSLAMSPAAKISTAGSVVVNARVSKSGQANAQPGDFEGTSAATAGGGQGVQVLIRDVVK